MADAGSLYRSLAPAVRGYLRAHRVDDPDDVLGEVFLHVARDLPRFQGGPDEARRWVFTIAHHRMVDAHRRRRRQPPRSDAEVPDGAAPVVEPIDPELLRALDVLTPEQRRVVVLRFVADLSLEEVARVTGRRVGAVKAMQHRALARLARELAPAPTSHPYPEEASERSPR
jgi:RNA polymerase sigma factor (sigma-70 family)